MTDAYLSDPLWSDAPEELPDGSFVLVREIKKALDGDKFKYIPRGERKQSDVPSIEPEIWGYYYSVHRFSSKFGLPNGKVWIDELPWVPEFLAYMDDLKNSIESWRMTRKKSSDSGSPSMFMGD